MATKAKTARSKRVNWAAAETRSLQVWPSGKSYSYQGDPDGPAERRRLKRGNWQARLQCPANCRRLYLDLLDPEERTRYASDASTFPDMGRYIEPAPEPAPWWHGTWCRVCQGEGHITNPIKNPWRSGSPAEWREIRIALRAEMYGREYVKGCDSSLVGDLLSAAQSGGLNDGERGRRSDLAEAFDWDQVANLRPDPDDWDAGQCREYAEERGIDLPDVPMIECPKMGDEEPEHHTDCGVCKSKGEIPAPDYAEDDSRHGWLTEARDAIRDNATEAEILEWWRVDRWLCEQLAGIGECVLDNGYGHWWGRQGSGQAWIMDGVLQRVAETFERDREDQ